MSNRLTKIQATLLGLLVLAVLAVGGAGLAALAAKDLLWADKFEVTVLVPDAGDLPPGTPVRLRGVHAGHVLRVEYPTDDAESVRLIVRLDGQYRGRLFNDASVKALAIQPGTSAAGVHDTNVLTAKPGADLAAVAEKMIVVADDAGALLKDARTATGKIETEAANVRGMVNDGRDTLRSVRQSTDALQKMPLIRGYVENATALLVRPELRRERYSYKSDDLFEPGTAILHDAGRQHLANLVELLKTSPPKTEFVVAALAHPNDASLTTVGAEELTRKQAQVVLEALMTAGAHKTGFWEKNRVATSIGLGTGPSPLVENDLPPARVTVYAFHP